MRYSEYHPQPPLSQFVECFWTLESKQASVPTPPERILPDGCVELILNFGDPFTQHQDGSRFDQPRNFVVGQMTGPILISPTGAVELIGIRFHPGGTLPFFKVPLHEITDRVVKLSDLAQTFEKELLESAADESCLAKRLNAIEAVLLKTVEHSSHNSFVQQLAAEIVDSGGLTSIDLLAHHAGISTRQLERRFLNEVGLSPKLLSRILRFQQVFRAIEYCKGEWAPIALECGYYDQAHLIRDFNQFAQQTPAILLAEQTKLAEAFTRKSRMSHFSNTDS